MINQGTILVIDDELQIRRLLEITLSANGYHVVEASTGKEGISLAASVNPDLVILDLGLPDADGLEILQRFREWMDKPVIILSVRNSEDDIVRALDQGANDYLTKPFRTGELLARIRVAMRHTGEEKEDPVLQFGEIVVDLVNHTVRKCGVLVKLTTIEYNLFVLMAKNEGRVLTHQYILKQIWGMAYTEQTQYLRVFMAQLRKKLEDDAAHPVLFNTESGIGYRFGS